MHTDPHANINRRVPTRCPRCGNCLSMVKGSYLTFGCGTRYRALDGEHMAIVARCNDTDSLGVAEPAPSPDDDPVHGDLPRSEPKLLVGSFAQLRAAVAVYGAHARIAGIVAREVTA